MLFSQNQWWSFPVFGRVSMARALRRVIGLATLLIAGFLSVSRVQAHDPLEIVASVYLHTNHVEVTAEMESRPARVLSGVTRGLGADEVLRRLNKRAGSLLRLWSGEQVLNATSADVSAGREEHVRLRYTFPLPGGGPIRVEAPMLVELGLDTGYGVSVTVLDMVNQKVIGQSVLFADSPSATFDSAPLLSPSVEPSSSKGSPFQTSAGSAAAQNSPPGSRAQPISAYSFSFLWWGVAALLGLAAISWWMRRRLA